MIKYYAYYNHGGYKDFYLGNSEDSVLCRYFLPLLSIYESDGSMSETVKEWKELPSMVNLSSKTQEYNYPEEAKVMVSHAGYKLQYRVVDKKGVLSLRDIVGNKDAYGRSCPFVFMMVADTDEECQLLDSVCYYIWKNLGETESLLSTLFINDFNVNGLRFELKRFNDYLHRILASTNEAIELNTYNRRVRFFLVPKGMRFATAFEEQQITKNDVSVAYSQDSSSSYRYSPPQVYYGPSGYPPINIENSQERQYQETPDTEQHHSLRKALGFAKAEDLEALKCFCEQLFRRVEELETKVQKLENQ